MEILLKVGKFLRGIGGAGAALIIILYSTKKVSYEDSLTLLYILSAIMLTGLLLTYYSLYKAKKFKELKNDALITVIAMGMIGALILIK